MNTTYTGATNQLLSFGEAYVFWLFIFGLITILVIFIIWAFSRR